MAFLSNFTVTQAVYLIALGLIPSIVWLVYYLRKDTNPEPKMMVWNVFLFGFISTFVAFGLEWAFIKAVFDSGLACLHCEYAIPQLVGVGAITSAGFMFVFILLAGLAFIEEWVKYLAAKIRIIRSTYFDEPIDAMIYLIVAALGFAAAENIGYIFQNAEWALEIAYFRFISATFLHVLASAIIGYFFALSLIFKRNHIPYLTVGILLATALHTVFNFLIMTSDGDRARILELAGLMIGSFFFVSWLFTRIRTLTFADARQHSL